jgi:glycosyltransferase involved in cell wall biosynthesis
MPDQQQLNNALRTAYGVEPHNLHLETVYNPLSRGDNLRIAFHAVRQIRRVSDQEGVILSRNLYASFVLAVLYRMPLLFETHQLETGYRKWMQRMVMICPRVTTIVISNHLNKYLTDHHDISPNRVFVLPDAAPEGIQPIPPLERRTRLGRQVELARDSWKQICGYFGHLYPGRGIEIVEAMAVSCPNKLFLVYGGNESELESHQRDNQVPNLVYMGHVSHPEARKLMCLMDVLLMPYQENVSIGVSGHDTARWMSPMKMFEYLGSGVPVISSDLPALREILKDGQNCLLVPPSDTQAWISALSRLDKNSELALKLGSNAHREYSLNYTWTRRAEKIIEASRQL